MLATRGHLLYIPKEDQNLNRIINVILQFWRGCLRLAQNLEMEADWFLQSKLPCKWVFLNSGVLSTEGYDLTEIMVLTVSFQKIFFKTTEMFLTPDSSHCLLRSKT